jgi:hypothetical protein
MSVPIPMYMVSPLSLVATSPRRRTQPGDHVKHVSWFALVARGEPNRHDRTDDWKRRT